MSPRISVIGTGYLGATHAACLAELGFDVLGVDSDPHKVAMLNAARPPFSEPGLGELLARHVRTGRLRFSTHLPWAAERADVHFICVGTPQCRSGPEADVSAVFTVAHQLARHSNRDFLVIGKSTVPVGTAEAVSRTVTATAPSGVTGSVAWNPEFLREGHGVGDTLSPDRLVFGVKDREAEATLRRIYEQPIAAGAPVHVTDLATAELAKVAANAFLATKISFINAMAEVSDRSGADVVALADILGDDTRIGRRFLDAGIGFGGGCLPKDIRGFTARATQLGAESVANLLREVDVINVRVRQRAVDLANELCDWRMPGRRIAVLGAAFKPRSDDVRDSPALDIAGRLHLQGAHVRVYDPEAGDNARAASPALTHVDSVEAALTGADLVLHLTDWPEFLSLDPHRLAGLVRRRRIVDGRNRLDRSLWADAGWLLRGFGRSPQTPQPRPRVGHATATYAVDPLAVPAGSHGGFADPAYRLLERT
jgi:UDPglucose 6-dehydrogenase